MQIQRPKGTTDVLPSESHGWQFLEQAMREACRQAGYQEVRTPVFEHTELFQRGVGDTTDVVQKEMYTFEDKGGRSVTLKPEGTAGVVRMLIEQRLYAEAMPVKVYYLYCPNFRYEKPQAGRYREFHQFGVEAFGAGDATLDAEIIALAWNLLGDLGIQGKRLMVNSIGCPTCRPAYHQALKAFLGPKLDKLCPTCRERFDRNPMRILDCKSEACQAEIAGAPVGIDYLCGECHDHFEALKAYLKAANLDFTVNTGIVRGLDYYTKTVFEIKPLGEGEMALSGGGRYDGLVEQLGGPRLQGAGFGMGMERVLGALVKEGLLPQAPPVCQVYLCPLGAEVRGQAFGLMCQLRRAGLSVDMDHCGRSLKAQLKFVGKLGSPLALILGGDELARGVAVLRDMRNAQQQEIGLKDVAGAVKAALAE